MPADVGQYAERLRTMVRSYYDREISRDDYLQQRRALCEEIERMFMGGERTPAKTPADESE